MATFVTHKKILVALVRLIRGRKLQYTIAHIQNCNMSTVRGVYSSIADLQTNVKPHFFICSLGVTVGEFAIAQIVNF